MLISINVEVNILWKPLGFSSDEEDLSGDFENYVAWSNSSIEETRISGNISKRKIHRKLLGEQYKFIQMPW